MIVSQGHPDSMASVPPNERDGPTLAIWHEQLELAQPLVAALIDAGAIMEATFTGPRRAVKIQAYLARIVPKTQRVGAEQKAE